MTDTIALKNRVRELRERLGLRQEDLAREVNITRQYVLAIEKGRMNPSIAICLRLARVFREPVDYVFYLERNSKRDDRSSPADGGQPDPAIWDL